MNNVIEKNIENLIYEVRGNEVMLDCDLAKLYQVDTKRINEAVFRNKEKFPERFSFMLNDIETQNLRSQNATSSLANNYGGRRYNPRVFTEQGVYMLATILKSQVATKVTISIMDTFVTMRNYIKCNKDLIPNRLLLLEDKVDQNTKQINELFDLFNPKDIAKEYLFFENQLFKSHYVLMKIFDQAKKEIIIIDNYVSKELLKELSEINKDIKIVSKNISETLQKKYESEFNNITFLINNTIHDRFIVLDRKILYTCGASFKDLGKKCFYIGKIDDNEIIDALLCNIFELESL